MSNRKKDWRRMYAAESELAFASPKRAAKLSKKIIRLKWKIFENE